jgi:hypothetical protein
MERSGTRVFTTELSNEQTAIQKSRNDISLSCGKRSLYLVPAGAAYGLFFQCVHYFKHCV